MLPRDANAAVSKVLVSTSYELFPEKILAWDDESTGHEEVPFINDRHQLTTNQNSVRSAHRFRIHGHCGCCLKG